MVLQYTLPTLRRLAIAVLAVAALGACGQPVDPASQPTRRWPRQLPPGWRNCPSREALPPENKPESCDLTASLRPFPPTKAEADAAVPRSANADG